MEILSFVLGIALVVVIAVAIVAVYAFVKVNKVNKEIETIHTIMGNESERVNRDMSDLRRDIFSSLDSRLDKLENKLYNKK